MSSIGTVCRQAREAKGMSLNDAANDTHIKVKYIAAIEDDDFSRMPAVLYAKGFVKIYAEYLGLDPEPLLQQFATPGAKSRQPVAALVKPVPPPARKFERESPPAVPPPPPVAPVVAAAPAAQVQQKTVSKADVVSQAAPVPKASAAAPLAEAETQRFRKPVPPVTGKPGAVPPPTHAAEKPATPPPVPAQPAARGQSWDRASAAPEDLFHPDLVKAIWRYLPIGIGALVVIVLLLSGVNHWARKRHAGAEIAPVTTPAVPEKHTTQIHGAALRLGEEPPAPYIDSRK